MSSGQDQMCVLEEENVENKTQSENASECWHIKLKCGYQSKDPTTYLSLKFTFFLTLMSGSEVLSGFFHISCSWWGGLVMPSSPVLKEFCKF